VSLQVAGNLYEHDGDPKQFTQTSDYYRLFLKMCQLLKRKLCIFSLLLAQIIGTLLGMIKIVETDPVDCCHNMHEGKLRKKAGGRQADDHKNTKTICVYKSVLRQGALMFAGSDITTTFAICSDPQAGVI
jgi:hypothetical protein